MNKSKVEKVKTHCEGHACVCNSSFQEVEAGDQDHSFRGQPELSDTFVAWTRTAVMGGRRGGEILAIREGGADLLLSCRVCIRETKPSEMTPAGPAGHTCSPSCCC